MAERTSNRQILDAIENQTASIDRLVEALTTTAISDAPAKPEAEQSNSVDVSEGYLAKMTEKAAAHATKHGAEVVLYARNNKAGETKLAYALRERYDTLRDGGLIGPVGSFQP